MVESDGEQTGVRNKRAREQQRKGWPGVPLVLEVVIG